RPNEGEGARWSDRNSTESLLPLKLNISLIRSSWAINIPMRQPAILDDLLNELSSMAISSAPGTDNILCGLGFNIKLYGLSWQIRILCRLPKAMISSNISAVACAPVGMCG